MLYEFMEEVIAKYYVRSDLRLEEAAKRIAEEESFSMDATPPQARH